MSDLKLQTKCFNLKYTLECGQCFRWEKVNENEYVGVIKDRVVRLRQVEDILYVWSSKKENLEEVIKEYLDLDKDYEKLEETISKIDKNIQCALEYSSGIHILNQNPFETIISYIISANNNIKRISKSVKDISKMYGKKVEFECNTYYLFPTLDEIKNITIDDLLKAGTGFRARYILKDIEYFVNNLGYIESLNNMDTLTARKSLMSLMGVGPKVADCILLFAYKRSEVFPVDVWIKRIMEKLYFNRNVNVKEITEFASDKFGGYSGIIQQHLFQNVREGKL